jgi:peroxiredoxin
LHTPSLLLRALPVSLLAVLFATSCSSPSHVGDSEGHASPLKTVDKRNAAPNFSLKDVNGQTVQLSDFKGKVVLLNFWATWCAPCRIEIPWFKEFERTMKDKGFAVIGVAMDDEGWEVVKPYLEENQVNYRVVMGTESMANLYGGVTALPITFLIDREGRIAATHVGLVSKKDYEREIRELL